MSVRHIIVRAHMNHVCSFVLHNLRNAASFIASSMAKGHFRFYISHMLIHVYNTLSFSLCHFSMESIERPNAACLHSIM